MVLQETKEWVLTAVDRCDAECSAQAYVIVKGVTGELLLCGNHYKKIMSSPTGKEKLEAFAFEIIDETDKLIENRLKGDN